MVALPLASWSHILGSHIQSWKPWTWKPPLKLCWAQASLTRAQVLGRRAMLQLRVPVVGVDTM